MIRKFLRDKKGSEKLFSLWWFFILAMVGAGIVAGVFIFYSADFDVREIEAESLYNRLSNCVVEQGYLTDTFFDESFDVFERCDLDKGTATSGDFYFKISILDANRHPIKEISEGTRTFEADCKIGGNLVAKDFPKCIEKEESVIYYQDNEKRNAIVYILTASNQRGRKLAT